MSAHSDHAITPVGPDDWRYCLTCRSEQLRQYRNQAAAAAPAAGKRGTIRSSNTPGEIYRGPGIALAAQSRAAVRPSATTPADAAVYRADRS